MPRKKNIDSKIEALILEGARQAVEIAERRAIGRVTELLTPIAEARAKLNLPRAEFTTLLGVSPRTVENWEQGRGVRVGQLEF
jgi:DNA-binding transcriptional regulator YiaG